MVLKREIISCYSKNLCSHPIAWVIKEFFSDGTVILFLSFRKTYNFNCIYFESFSELEYYTTSKGWIK